MYLQREDIDFALVDHPLVMNIFSYPLPHSFQVKLLRCVVTSC
jgi:hypothetical protein